MKCTSDYCKNQVFSPLVFCWVSNSMSFRKRTTWHLLLQWWSFRPNSDSRATAFISMLVGMGKYISQGLTFFVINEVSSEFRPCSYPLRDQFQSSGLLLASGQPSDYSTWLFWSGQIAIQRTAVLWVRLKTVLCRTFPLNFSEEPFSNLCERFEAERIFAVFTATSTRNCNFLQQVPGNCSDKEPYFSAWLSGKYGFCAFRPRCRGNDIPVKNRRFLSEISVTHATPCRDNLPSNYPDFWKNANNHTIRERDTKFPKKLASVFEK